MKILIAIRRKGKVIIGKLVSFNAKIKSLWKKNYEQTGRGIYWFVAVFFSIVFGRLTMGSGMPFVIDLVLFSLLGFLVFLILRLVLFLILSLIKRIEIKAVSYLFLFFMVLLLLLIAGSVGTIAITGLIVSALLLSIGELLFVASIIAFLKKRRSIMIVAILTVTTVLNIGVATILFTEGTKESYISDYLFLNTELEIEPLEIYKESIQTGSYEIAATFYGDDNKSSMKSNTVNLKAFSEKSKGLTRFVRKLYLGYDLTEVPVAGKVWYPIKEGTYPLLVIVHGNHTLTEDSYLGYDYLGEHLASRGFVVASVDENALNSYVLGLSGENDARAVLLLENLKQLEYYNQDSGSVLYEKIDFSNIAIAGHSRGGEAVAIATLFNDMDCYPENGNIKFDYHFNIGSVIAIAPTCDQYKPIDKTVALEDINYFLIQGANDQDVNVFMGIKQYENITFSGEKDCFKSYLYVAGVNHGQFNTTWGRYDLPSILKHLLNTEALMEGASQEELLKGYMTAFLEGTMLGKTENQDLFRNYRMNAGDLPKTVYIQGYEDASFLKICDFEDDINLSTGTLPNSTLQASEMTKWTEEELKYSNALYSSSKGNYGVTLKWEDTLNAKYSLSFSEKLVIDVDDYLQFSIMDTSDEAVKNGDYSNFDCSIVIVDNKGNSSKIQLSEYYTIYPPLPVQMYKLQALMNIHDYKHYMQTVRIPLKAFVEVNSGVSLNDLKDISFVFDQQDSGSITLDHIGIGQ